MVTMKGAHELWGTRNSAHVEWDRRSPPCGGYGQTAFVDYWKPSYMPPTPSHLPLVPSLSRHLILCVFRSTERKDVQHSVIYCCALAPALRNLTGTLTGLS